MAPAIFEKIYKAAQSHGRPQRALISWPPTCEFGMILYFFFGVCCAVSILWYDMHYNTQVLSFLYSRETELKMAKIGCYTTIGAVFVLITSLTLAPQSKLAIFLSTVSRLSDPRFPELNPPVFEPTLKDNLD